MLSKRRRQVNCNNNDLFINHNFSDVLSQRVCIKHKNCNGTSDEV